MPPGSAAAVASLEYQLKNSRSMNHMTDQKQVCTISGSATARTSRPPHGRDHQPLASAGLCSRGSDGAVSDSVWRSVSTSTLALRPIAEAILGPSVTQNLTVGFAPCGSILSAGG